MACQTIHTLAEKADTHRSAVRRLARPSDLAALFELDRVCFGRRAWSLRAWCEVVTAPDWTTVVVERKDAVVAVSVLLPAAPVSWLASLAVHPAWRRKGLARSLVRNALERARIASAHWLSLEVDRTHGAAVTLYRREGFGVLRRFREDGRWRQEMVRRLGGTRGL
ncbi:MAG: GNAT family N-acetyltransferase [Acidobacteriia bacterium]|nr:GNAT family N-acetyltransferase [Terriglobia bacterium]